MAFRYPDYRKGTIGTFIPLDCFTREPGRQLSVPMPLAALGATAEIAIIRVSTGEAVVTADASISETTAHRFEYAVTAEGDAALHVGEHEVYWRDVVDGVPREFGPYPLRVTASPFGAFAPASEGGGPGENAAWVAIH